MKIISILIISILVVSACVKTTNGNNTTVTVIPNSPTNLMGTVISATRVNLTWTDNATNEQGFKIDRKTGNGNYALIDSVNADITNYADTSLTPNTTYTYRVYAYNIAGNSLYYTNEVTVTTNNIPIVITSFNNGFPNGILDTTSFDTLEYNSFKVGNGTYWSDTIGYTCEDGIGVIIHNVSNMNIIEEGLVWSSTPNPILIQSNKTVFNIDTSFVSSKVTNLTANTIYYVRGYVITNQGTYYGNVLKFKTLKPQSPSSFYLFNQQNGRTSNILNYWFNDGGYFTISRGIVWSTSPNPTLSLSTKNYVSGPNGGIVNYLAGENENFNDTILGLSPNTTYYFKAFATNILGTSLDTVQYKFTTLP